MQNHAPLASPLVTVGALVLALFLAGRIDLVDLVDRGYGSLTFLFIVVVIGPLFTVGLWRIFRADVKS